MKSVRELTELMPGLLTCDCDSVVMSHDVKLRCRRVRARFHAANNLACHGTYTSLLGGQRIATVTNSHPLLSGRRAEIGV